MDYKSAAEKRKKLIEESNAKRVAELRAQLEKQYSKGIEAYKAGETRENKPQPYVKPTTNHQLYKKYFPTYWKISGMDKNQRKRFDTDPGYQWMIKRTALYIYLALSGLALFIGCWSAYN